MPDVCRRDFLRRSGLGFGMLALADLLRLDGQLARAGAAPRAFDLAPRPPHFAPRAKAVVLLFQNGGPSQMDLFDRKPELQKRDGQLYGRKVEVLQPGNSDKLAASSFKFSRHGGAGMEFSELVPNLGGVADDLCLIRSMHTGNNNHPQGVRIFTTGKVFPGRPTMGAWISYGLGTENQNLPAFVALRDPKGYSTGGPLNWDSGWLPSIYRGTEFRSQGEPVLNLHPAVPLPETAQRSQLALMDQLNREHSSHHPHDSDLEARIRHYELAARMQLSAEDVLNLKTEPKSVRAMYGLDDPVTADYGTRCLMTRRLIEAGVRFVHVDAPREGWDHHSNLRKGIQGVAARVDKPAAALIRDLKQRGLLDETIVIWSGEFGRLPVSQNGNGRDHNRHAFSLLVAGGGFKSGHIHGATDDFGYQSVENRVSCHDLHATILHQLGLDHEQLTYHHEGREESLTDPAVNHARIVGEILREPPVIA
jgi:hypothetical protein